MIIREHTPREYAVAWGGFLSLYAVIHLLTLYLGRFVDAQWDFHLLLWLNPDNYVFLLDEFIILKTDFATYFVVILLLAWQIGYYCSRNNPEAQQRTRLVFYGLACLFAIWHFMGLFVQERGIFWWSEYEYPIVFVPLALAFGVGFVVVGNIYVRFNDEDQRKLAQAFWLTLVAVFFINIVGEDMIKELVGRHRPLHDSYAPWNEQIRQLPDEVVRGSHSYISGHTSGFWAITMIYFWLFRSVGIKAGILVAGLLQGYTRIYTAAHFPYCVIMASVFAIAVSFLVYYFLWNHRHLPLLAMAGLVITLYLLTGSAVASLILLVIVLAWFFIHQYVTRHDLDEEEPLDAIIDMSS